MNLKLPSPTLGTIYAALAVGALVVLWTAWWAIIIRPAENAKRAAQAEAGQVFADARTESARDAVGAITEKAAQDAASEDLTRKNRDEILAQPGASVVVSPDVAAAGRRAICMRDAARCRPECQRLLGPCPAGARSRGSGA
jgi:hypothetical protein